MSLLYIEKIPAAIRSAFETKLRSIAAFLLVEPEWLMQVMFAESGLNPKAQNKSKNDGHLIAAGLIQWTTASGVPGAPASILQLDALQQLDLVKQYFTPYRGKMKSYFDVYLVTFFPAAVGKPDNYVFQTSKYSPALIAAQNPAINRNKDSQITMAEFKQYVTSTIPKTIQQIIFKAKELIVDNSGKTAGALIFFLQLLF